MIQHIPLPAVSLINKSPLCPPPYRWTGRNLNQDFLIHRESMNEFNFNHQIAFSCNFSIIFRNHTMNIHNIFLSWKCFGLGFLLEGEDFAMESDMESVWCTSYLDNYLRYYTNMLSKCLRESKLVRSFHAINYLWSLRWLDTHGCEYWGY